MKIYAEAAFSWVGRQQLFERADESKVVVMSVAAIVSWSNNSNFYHLYGL